MKTTPLHTALLATLLSLGGISGNACAQQAAPAAATAATDAPAAGNPATTRADSANNPNADRPPLQAQELVNLVPRDSSQPRPTDVSRDNANNAYRYDKSGANCTLYPARCRGESY